MKDLSNVSGAVVSAVLKKGGKVLLQNHVKIGAWTLPSGSVEEGETPEEAIKREVFEELGIKEARYDLIGMFLHEDDVIEHRFSVITDEEPTNMEPDKHMSQPWVDYVDMPALKHSRILTSWLECTAQWGYEVPFTMDLFTNSSNVSSKRYDTIDAAMTEVIEHVPENAVTEVTCIINDAYVLTGGEEGVNDFDKVAYLEYLGAALVVASTLK